MPLWEKRSRKPIEMYVTRMGSVPFEEWLLRLRDARARARIRARLARLRLGNPGDAHAVGGGVWGLRIDYGPGYRVYYAQSGTATILNFWRLAGTDGGIVGSWRVFGAQKRIAYGEDSADDSAMDLLT